MNEIERAIEQLESLMYEAGHKGDVEDYNALKTAIELLRAELSRQENAPLTWNERINQMTVDEKAEWVKEYLFDSACEGVCMYNGCNGACTENIIAFFNSPYTEGEKK